MPDTILNGVFRQYRVGVCKHTTPIKQVDVFITSFIWMIFLLVALTSTFTFIMFTFFINYFHWQNVENHDFISNLIFFLFQQKWLRHNLIKNSKNIFRNQKSYILHECSISVMFFSARTIWFYEISVTFWWIFHFKLKKIAAEKCFFVHAVDLCNAKNDELFMSWNCNKNLYIWFSLHKNNKTFTFFMLSTIFFLLNFSF